MGLTDQGKNNSDEDHARRVREMFARISPRYDLLNHLLSGNIDKRWRRIVVEKLRPLLSPDSKVLDVACGTGDLSIALFENIGARVTGLDFCRPMLERAARKPSQVAFVEGDALQLPFGDRVFDAVTIAFGLRNLSSVEQGLNELRRVLKPNGWAAILEFSKPVVPGFRSLAAAYCTRLLPRIGGMISGSRSAYEYLPDSVARFPDQETLSAMMRVAGLADVEFQNLTGGVAALHTGRRV
ncbi:MAG: demethylmenaquinone methyltransferase / 2-methoxy-6-polyprenyl,4-benzoquinol methylase [Blastocatellia bacterium]|jgi:demethylmenaquinone methyltransferase/2-methoxy-6-polyprenyl-1,4-benzoquinol methylase|nr:demethylmenaquinone methyltransferase / 2-methoxy-6-polyprenyl,4-benzoquinol methylase [Blastocatellia bacterium]